MERVASEYEQTISHFSHPHPLKLSKFQAQKPLKTQSTNCSACKLEPSDWIYSCALCNFLLHAKCSKLPKYVTHPYHEEHVLCLLSQTPKVSQSLTCDACKKSGDGFIYNCEHCNCNLHVHCAVLPMSRSHSTHPHQLRLTFDIPNSHLYLYCDICEETSYNQWFYWCSSCDFCVHLGCVDRNPVIKPTAWGQGATPKSRPQHEHFGASRSINPGLQVNPHWNQGRQQTTPFMETRPLNLGYQVDSPGSQGRRTEPSIPTAPLYPGLMYPQTPQFRPVTIKDHQRMVLQQAIQQLRGANAIQNRVAINMLESMVEGLGNGIGNSAMQSLMKPSGGVLGQNMVSGLFEGGDPTSIPGFDGLGGVEGLFGGLFS